MLGLLLTIVVIVGILAAESVIHKRKTDRLKVENELIGILRLSNDDLVSQITRKTLFREQTVRITVPRPLLKIQKTVPLPRQVRQWCNRREQQHTESRTAVRFHGSRAQCRPPGRC